MDYCQTFNQNETFYQKIQMNNLIFWLKTDISDHSPIEKKSKTS